MDLQVFSQMALVMEALLTNRAGVASQCFVLLISIFSDVMFPYDVFSLKVLAAYLRGKAGRLMMSRLCR